MSTLSILVYLYVTSRHATGVLEPEEELHIRDQLIQQWKDTSEDPNTKEEFYRCGWVYLASEYRERPGINLLVLQKMKGRSRGRFTGVYFLVMKHDSLFLYESEEQTVCCSVILIRDCKVDMFPHSLTMDELYHKIYPIRILSKNHDIPLYEGKPSIYIYAPNGSEKEDWFFAMRRVLNASTLQIENAQSGLKLAEAIFMERLGRYARCPQIDTSSQWLNALGGRIFYNLFRSADIERFLRLKVQKKIDAEPVPFFLGELNLKTISPGQSIPMVSKGQLHSVGHDGEVIASMDVFYPGGLRITIATDIRWDIPRVKTIVVPVEMSIQIRRFTGRAMVRIKAPPSDRLWVGFYKQPHLDIDVEPALSSTAISWSVIKSGLLKQMNDTIAEYLVLPNMEDLTIPPLIIGDQFGGEKPFDTDHLPSTMLKKAQQLDLSAHGVCVMMKALDFPARYGSPVDDNVLERGLFKGSHSASSIPLPRSPDLKMEPISGTNASKSKRSSTANLLDGARRSDILARERTRTITEADLRQNDQSAIHEANNITGSKSQPLSTSESAKSSPSRHRHRDVIYNNVRRSIGSIISRVRPDSMFFSYYPTINCNSHKEEPETNNDNPKAD